VTRGATPAARRDGLVVAAIALVVRSAVAVWAASRFPAAADGFYYDTLARRLAGGDGYTWLWPDGAVTSVAHYPVGYPAILALVYALFGAHPVAAMLVNALFGAAMALAVHRLLLPAGGAPSRPRWLAAGGALAVALHPALVPYTAALMTEGIAAALLAIAAVAAAAVRTRSRHPWLALGVVGLALGIATLVRPQCLAFAPLLGLLAPRAPAAPALRARGAIAVTAVALAVCAPWTVRNCIAMHQCALVSVNGGWNLLIGAQTTNGAWQPVDVPAACRTVWGEAAKDRCFADAAGGVIAGAPFAWLARIPAKVAVTFDYFGAGPWYLHDANRAAFGDDAKLALGVVETVVSSVFLLAALGGVALAPGPRRRARIAIAAGGIVCALAFLHGAIAYLALAVAILVLGPRYLARAPLVLPWTAVVVLVTAATHAVFFGAGRYGLVVVPFVTALAWEALVPLARLRDPGEDAKPALVDVA
jgi:hypothetical protein